MTKVTINAADLPKLTAIAKKLRRGGGNVLDVMLARRGETRESLPRFSRTGKALRRDGVPACSEWQRIDALPRRERHTDPELDELVELMTEHLKTPKGTQRLWPIQAVCLREIADQRGLIGGVRVSGGKSLIAMLAPTVLEAQRPMIIVPAKSIKSGKIDKAYQDARKHWQISQNIQWISYEMIQTLQYADLLEKYRPDCVVADESHKWGRETGSTDTARTARAQRFIDGVGAEVPFVLLSGTFMGSHVIKDVARPCEWALKDRSPVPRTKKAQKDWADALEVDPSYSKRLAEQGEDPRPRMEPGALARWCSDTEDPDDLSDVRRAYGRRYTQTPGVVVSSGDALGQSLVIECKLNPDHDAAVEAAFAELRGDPKNDVPPKAPDGWILVDAVVIWSMAQQLELGFYYRCEPRPPGEWTLARQTWASYCRERIKRGDIDTELQVANECRAYAAEGVEIPAWEEWRAIRDSFKPNVVPVWLSERRVDQAAAWLKKHRGLCWTQFRAFGEKLSAKHKIPFFSSDACDIEGNSILEYPGGPAIVSVAACSEDLNLQDRWHTNLVPAPPSTGQAWEQFLARTHRFGQPKGEVTCETWIGCIENAEALEKAREKERAVALASLDEARKLLVADWDDRCLSELPRRGRRWTRPSK